MRRGGAGRRPAMMAARMARMMAARMHRRRRRRRVMLVGGLVAFGAYKLSKKDVEKVEQHTGKPAEELSDQEMEQAMDDLGIEREEMTDDDWAEVERQDAEPDPAAPAPAGGEEDYLAELERLADLRDKGILTDEEFDAKKKQLLGM